MIMGGQLDGLLSHWQPAFANKLIDWLIERKGRRREELFKTTKFCVQTVLVVFVIDCKLSAGHPWLRGSVSDGCVWTVRLCWRIRRWKQNSSSKQRRQWNRQRSRQFLVSCYWRLLDECVLSWRHVSDYDADADDDDDDVDDDDNNVQ